MRPAVEVRLGMALHPEAKGRCPCASSALGVTSKRLGRRPERLLGRRRPTPDARLLDATLPPGGVAGTGLARPSSVACKPNELRLAVTRIAVRHAGRRLGRCLPPDLILPRRHASLSPRSQLTVIA